MRQVAHLSLELLEKLLNDEIRVRFRRTGVESRPFGERFEQALVSYQNRSTRTAWIIAQLIAPLEGNTPRWRAALILD